MTHDLFDNQLPCGRAHILLQSCPRPSPARRRPSVALITAAIATPASLRPSCKTPSSSLRRSANAPRQADVCVPALAAVSPSYPTTTTGEDPGESDPVDACPLCIGPGPGPFASRACDEAGGGQPVVGRPTDGPPASCSRITKQPLVLMPHISIVDAGLRDDEATARAQPDSDDPQL